MGYTIEDEPTLTLEERTLHEDLKKLLEKQNKDILSSMGATQTEEELAQAEQDYINYSENYMLDNIFEEPRGKKLPLKALDYVQLKVVKLEKEIEAEYRDSFFSPPKAHPAIQWAIDAIDWVKKEYTDYETTEEKHNRNIKDRKDLRSSTVESKRKDLIKKVIGTYKALQAVYSAKLRDQFRAKVVEYIKNIPRVKDLENVEDLTDLRLISHENGENGETILNYEISGPENPRTALKRIAKKHNFKKAPKGQVHLQYKKDKLEIYIKKASGEN